MLTSAGIGTHFEETLKKSVAHAVAVESAVRAMAGGAVTLVAGALCAFVLLALQTDAKSDCDAARDHQGYGRVAALAALDHPDAQSRFLYRVTPDVDGYRAVVVARTGEWLGDTWERDAIGDLRHVTDLCSDKSALATVGLVP